jgi:hypothetical protein
MPLSDLTCARTRQPPAVRLFQLFARFQPSVGPLFPHLQQRAARAPESSRHHAKPQAACQNGEAVANRALERIRRPARTAQSLGRLQSLQPPAVPGLLRAVAIAIDGSQESFENRSSKRQSGRETADQSQAHQQGCQVCFSRAEPGTGGSEGAASRVFLGSAGKRLSALHKLQRGALRRAAVAGRRFLLVRSKPISIKLVVKGSRADP